MAKRAVTLPLGDILEAIRRIDEAIADLPLAAFEQDWRRQWLAERGVEIISEASRRLPESLKLAHPGIPWPKVAAIGNVLRHDYQSIAAPVLWKLIREDLPELKQICLAELAVERVREGR